MILSSPKGLYISAMASRVAVIVPDTGQVFRKSMLINQLCNTFMDLKTETQINMLYFSSHAIEMILTGREKL